MWLGREVKNDMSGQSKGTLRVCNVKIRKSLMGKNGARLFSKMVKLEQKESPDPKVILSDLVKFSKLSCLTCVMV